MAFPPFAYAASPDLMPRRTTADCDLRTVATKTDSRQTIKVEPTKLGTGTSELTATKTAQEFARHVVQRSRISPY
jgi:hypothetical protein